MKITGKAKQRFTDLSNIHNYPSREPVLPLNIVVDEAELQPYIEASTAFWDSHLKPITFGIMSGNDMTEATAFYYKHGHHLMHKLLGVNRTCEKADNILEKIITYRLITNLTQINNRLTLLILGSKSLTFTYREWLPQIIQEFEITPSINGVTELLAAKAFAFQKNWPIEQRAGLKHYLNMFTDLVQYYLLTNSKHEENAESKFINTQLDLTSKVNFTLLN